MMKERISVLVTGVGGRSIGHQILHGLLLLGSKYRVVVCDADSFSYGLYECPNRHRVPRADSATYVDAVLSLVRRENIDVILPGTEPEVRVLSEHIDRFTSHGCTILVNPKPVVQLCSNKQRLYEWLTEHRFHVPKFVPPPQWRTLAKDCGFPLLAKPTELSGSSRNVALLNSEAEIDQYLSALPPDLEVIFQQYIEGPESEYTVGVMISKSGELIDSIVLHRKLTGLSLGVERKINEKRYALSTGYSQGFIVKHPFVQEQCENLALTIGARGPMNVQCRLSGDKLYVFEVHPRFSGTSSFRADVGFNEPDTLIRNFCGDERFGRLSYTVNVAAIRAFSNIVVPLEELNAVPIHD